MVEIKPKPKCCRNLFGSPSGKEREQMKKIYSECLKEDINIGKEKYEYDIVSDTPLSDRWELTTTAPEFYTRQYTSREERLNPLKRKMDVESEPDNVESQNTSTCNSRPLRQPPLTSMYCFCTPCLFILLCILLLFIYRYVLGILCTMADVCHWWNPSQLRNIGTYRSFIMH